MVFQDYALYPHKSVYENIGFGLKIRKVPEKEIDKTVREVAEKLDLSPYLERKPADLSGGQRQRVAIGRAIVRNPKVFLFDEPLSNLDAKLRGTMRQTISTLHHELDATVVYVTHDQVEAMTLADRIIVLEGGKIQQQGSPLNLYYHPSNRFVATFIGSPSMTMVSGTVKKDQGQVFFTTAGGINFKVPEKFTAKLSETTKDGQKVSWGLRCENLSITESDEDFIGEVLMTEPLGNLTHVMCDIAGDQIMVSLPEPHRPVRGDKIKLKFTSTHLYMFDDETSLSLI
jgi:multiple sugar transport system ATP-binding protein